MYSKGTQTIEFEESSKSGETSTNESEASSSSSSSSKKQQSTLIQSQQQQQTNATSTSSANETRERITIREAAPQERQQIVQQEQFQKFVTKSSRVMERALYLGSEYDIMIDYAKSDSQSK
jgi:hypothetical protein